MFRYQQFLLLMNHHVKKESQVYKDLIPNCTIYVQRKRQLDFNMLVENVVFLRLTV